jgi:AcrR family transcriptional regulator
LHFHPNKSRDFLQVLLAFFMSNSRDKLLQAAASLFTAQGITDTTTKQISELATVNEVTLFRQFGNKHGLLLALMDKVPEEGQAERSIFDRLCQTLAQASSSNRSEFLHNYIQTCLNELMKVPALLLSVIGEAGQYPLANRQAIAQGLHQLDRQLASYLDRWPNSGLMSDRLAHILHRLVFGYALLELVSTSQEEEGMQDRSSFIQDVIDLLAPATAESTPTITVVADIPSTLVHDILQQAQKQSIQTFAWVYLLFAAGLQPNEIVRLRRVQYINDREQQFMQITGSSPRQVPINQWILGKRYGSYQKNPLTQWLRSRKDDYPELFVDVVTGRSLTVGELEEQWQLLMTKLESSIPMPGGFANGQGPTIEQSQHTWCVEMLVRGLVVSDLALLLGWEENQLEPYARRAREKIAMEQAMKLDRKPA